MKDCINKTYLICASIFIGLFSSVSINAATKPVIGVLSFIPETAPTLVSVNIKDSYELAVDAGAHILRQGGSVRDDRWRVQKSIIDTVVSAITADGRFDTRLIKSDSEMAARITPLVVETANRHIDSSRTELLEGIAVLGAQEKVDFVLIISQRATELAIVPSYPESMLLSSYGIAYIEQASIGYASIDLSLSSVRYRSQVNGVTASISAPLYNGDRAYNSNELADIEMTLKKGGYNVSAAKVMLESIPDGQPASNEIKSKLLELTVDTESDDFDVDWKLDEQLNKFGKNSHTMSEFDALSAPIKDQIWSDMSEAITESVKKSTTEILRFNPEENLAAESDDDEF